MMSEDWQGLRLGLFHFVLFCVLNKISDSAVLPEAVCMLMLTDIVRW